MSTRPNRRRTRNPRRADPWSWLIPTPWGPSSLQEMKAILYVSKITDDFTRMKNISCSRVGNRPSVPYTSTAKRWPSPLGSASNTSGKTRGWSTPQVPPRASQRFRHCFGVRNNRDSTTSSGRTISTIARCLLKDGNFPPSLWGKKFFAAAYNSNR